jgi:tetratricopeptide (TPR) repeat protein
LARLDQRLKLLTGGAQDFPERQQTLRKTIDWSYGLLPAEEQKLFARLSVFVGDCTLETVGRICKPEVELGIDTVDGLQSLVEQSLLRQDEGPEGEPRFWMLETIHEHARDRLHETGEADEFHRRHAEHFLSFASDVDAELKSGDQAATRRRIEREHDNLLGALAWAESIDEELLVQLTTALIRFWYVSGYLNEGRVWLERALETKTSSLPLRIDAFIGAAFIAHLQHDYAAVESWSEHALELARRLQDSARIARSLSNLAFVAAEKADFVRARSLLEESLELHRRSASTRDIAVSIGNIGYVALVQGDYERAAAFSEQAAELYRELEDKDGLAHSSFNHGLALFSQRRGREAAAHFQEALEFVSEIGEKLMTTYCLFAFSGLRHMRSRSERRC